MNIAFSPCPNDTFVFYAWVHNLIPGAPELKVTYADIDVTNALAAGFGGPDVVKISYGALPWVLREYTLLPCGGALGKGCGPLLLTADGADKPLRPTDLSGRRVAVPSERSTAYLLFRLWAAEYIPENLGEIVVLPFQEIMPAVRDGLVDAGLVIHEARFTYSAYDLKLLADLGEWWEADTGLPIPLGAIAARKTLDTQAVSAWIRASLKYAWEHREETDNYVLSHSQEMSPEVTKAHIDLYVNEYTEDIGEVGFQAVKTLLGRAAEAGLTPEADCQLLYHATT